MTVRFACLACLTFTLLACATDTKPPTPAPDAARSGATPAAWVITPEGIGDLRLGGLLAEPGNGFEDSYHTAFYGDRQPLEGFVFSDPPVFAVFKDGPFSVWGANHVGRPAPEAIQTRAVALASANRFKVEMLVITDPRPETEAGISVGDDYAEFARAYPRAPAPDAFVGLWEHPSCMVSRDTIWFFFDRCDDADRAKIIRIAVRTEGSRV